MPRYFIDTDDGHTYVHDDAGSIFPDDAAARRAARDVLPDLARGEIPDGDRRRFVAMVRTDTNDVLYTLTLSLVGARTIKARS